MQESLKKPQKVSLKDDEIPEVITRNSPVVSPGNPLEILSALRK